MKTIFCLLFFIFFLFSFSKAQTNLVPNSSFEIDTNCNGNLISFAPPWNSPTNGTPDLYNTCGTSINGALPTNLFGFQNTHSGNGYIGAGFYGYVSSFYYIEYLQIKLDTNLITNKRYCASFYLSLANNSKYAIRNLGMYFSDTLISEFNTTSNFQFTPQIIDANYETDTLNWVLFSGTFTAIGGERYLIIGNFKDSANTDLITVRPTGGGAYYYIDDVDVHLYNPETEPCCVCYSNIGIAEVSDEDGVKVYPNPTDGVFNLEFSCNDNQMVEINVYNLLGENVVNSKYNATKGSNKAKIDLQTLNEGIYIVRLYKNGIFANAKIIKQ